MPGVSRVGKPEWLKTKLPSGADYFSVHEDLRARSLVTVCEQARCPNKGECWATLTATFMVLGEVCTRGCRFCHIRTGDPGGKLNPDEPQQVAESAAAMKLRYVVMTMVDRDDLPDGGAAHVCQTVEALRDRLPGVRIEALTGDFCFNKQALIAVANSGLHVFAHNVETVAARTPRVRDRRASYAQSLEVLAFVKSCGPSHLITKSSVMLGVGETLPQLLETFGDLRSVGVDILTLGQYLQPTPRHLPVSRWVPPEEFERLRGLALELGFAAVVAGPLVRSSYRAAETYAVVQQGQAQ